MRGSVALALLFVASLVGPVALGQSGGQGGGGVQNQDSTIQVEDAAADVMIYALPSMNGPSQKASLLGSQYDHLDVMKLKFGDETDNEFKVTVTYKTLTVPAGNNPSRPIFFQLGKVWWSLNPGVCRQGFGGGGGGGGQVPATFTQGCLRGDGGGLRASPKTIPVETKGSDTLVYTVEKSSLFDHNRAPPRFGTPFVNISAQASQTIASAGMWDPTGGVRASDRVPDVDFAPVFTFAKGSNGAGHFAMSSAEPIRVSNGEATTIVYKVELLNHHTEKLSASLEAVIEPKYLEDGWSVRVPSVVKVPPQSTVNIPVILSLPFTHDHGQTALFKVAARGIEDKNSRAEVQLGVFWTDVPQPSAHHETADGGTFFHSAPSEGDFPPQEAAGVIPVYTTWMNGVDNDVDPDAKDDDVPQVFTNCANFMGGGCGVPPTYRVAWRFPLNPTLLLGLDFDMTKTGRMVFDVLPKVTANSATVLVSLRYCDPMDQGGRGGGGGGGFGNATCYNYSKVLAKGTDSKPLTGGTIQHYEIALKPETMADLVAYRKGANIRLDIEIATDTPQAVFGKDLGISFLTNKARMQLPLVEYHDPIDQAFSNLGTLAFEGRTPTIKQVNPGKTAVFGLDLKSTSVKDMDIHLEIQGVNKEWARFTGPTDFVLKSNEVRNVTIAVSVPGNAEAEERVPLFIVAQNTEDTDVVAMTPLLATVVTDPEIPDEAAQAKSAEGGQSPGLGLVALMAAVAGALWLGRRTR